jgi:hypothetical protein
MSKETALSLKEAIEAKSNRVVEPVVEIGELLGVDVDQTNSYFQLKTDRGLNIDGRLAETFPMSREWAMRVRYRASLLRVTTALDTRPGKSAKTGSWRPSTPKLKMTDMLDRERTMSCVDSKPVA